MRKIIYKVYKKAGRFPDPIEDTLVAEIAFNGNNPGGAPMINADENYTIERVVEIDGVVN
jgi:hypothetical protein